MRKTKQEIRKERQEKLNLKTEKVLDLLTTYFPTYIDLDIESEDILIQHTWNNKTGILALLTTLTDIQIKDFKELVFKLNYFGDEFTDLGFFTGNYTEQKELAKEKANREKRNKDIKTWKVA